MVTTMILFLFIMLLFGFIDYCNYCFIVVILLFMFLSVFVLLCFYCLLAIILYSIVFQHLYYIFIVFQHLFVQDSFFFGSPVPFGACRALFATYESKAACKFSLKSSFLLHFRPWDLSRKMRREILIEKDVLNVLRGAFCVELWSFYCKPKNSGPNVVYYVL